MKLLIFLTAISISLFSCTSATTDKNKKENLAIAKKYMEAVETNNAAIMDSLLADNYMGYGPSVGDSTNKADAISNWKYNAANLYESIKYTRHQDMAITVVELRLLFVFPGPPCSLTDPPVKLLTAQSSHWYLS